MEQTTGRLRALPLEEHVEIVLGLHKCVENATTGRARELARLEAVALLSFMNRVAPGAVDRILEEWDWQDIVERLEGGDDA